MKRKTSAAAAKPTKPNLHQIRRTLTPFQAELLQEVWQYYRTENKWPTLRALYRTHGKETVTKALSTLGGSVGWEERSSGRWNHYRLSLLGTLLTSDGPQLQRLMTRFFDFQRQLFQKEPERDMTNSAEIAEFLHLTAEETAVLGHLLFLGNFGGGQGGVNSGWHVTTMEEAPDFPQTGDLGTQFDDWICRFYRPDVAVFEDQRMAELSGRNYLTEPNVASSPPHPPEIVASLRRLHSKYPDTQKLGFLIMRFAPAKPFQRIVKVIKATTEAHGLGLLRADEYGFHADLWGNVQTLLHGCAFGIAVYERINTNEPNANVGLEVGYLMAMNKPVLLLKDNTVPALHSDLTGKLYKTFDPHDPEHTIPDQLTKWLCDNGIVVPRRT